MSFIDDLKTNINEVATLRITTAVGGAEAVPQGKGYRPAGDAKIMYSSVNLLEGDATTIIDPSFTKPENAALMQYHQAQQSNSRQLIASNIECIESLVKLFTTLEDNSSTTSETTEPKAE